MRSLVGQVASIVLIVQGVATLTLSLVLPERRGDGRLHWRNHVRSFLGGWLTGVGFMCLRMLW